MAVLLFLVSIPPAIGGLLSVIPTWNYALPNKEHERILGVLNQRRHTQEAGAADVGDEDVNTVEVESAEMINDMKELK